MSLPAYMYLYDENGQQIKGSCMALGREGASFPVYQLGKILQANHSGRFLAFSNPECWQGRLFSAALPSAVDGFMPKYFSHISDKGTVGVSYSASSKIIVFIYLLADRIGFVIERWG